MRMFALVALLVALPMSAQAETLKLRSLQGTVVRVADDAHGEASLIIAFSHTDREAAVRVRAVRQYARPRGLRVLLLCTDGPQEAVHVRRWARRHAADFPVFTDPDASVVRPDHAGSSTYLLSSEGERVARWGPWSDRVATELSARLETLPRAPESPLVGAISVEEMPLLQVSHGPPTPR